MTGATAATDMTTAAAAMTSAKAGATAWVRVAATTKVMTDVVTAAATTVIAAATLATTLVAALAIVVADALADTPTTAVAVTAAVTVTAAMTGATAVNNAAAVNDIVIATVAVADTSVRSDAWSDARAGDLTSGLAWELACDLAREMTAAGVPVVRGAARDRQERCCCTQPDHRAIKSAESGRRYVRIHRNKPLGNAGFMQMASQRAQSTS